MPLGDKIRKLRKDREWTQNELAAKLGVHGAHVTRWEKNRVAPSAKTLAKLAEVFEVAVDDLTRENGTPALMRLIPDPELLAQFQVIAQLDDEQRKAVKTILQAVVTTHQFKQQLLGR